MSVYKERMDKLSLDQSFKNSLLDKMRAKAQSSNIEQAHLQVDLSRNTQISAPKKDKKRRLIKVLAPLASAAVLCMVIVPVAISFSLGGNYNYYDAGENLSGTSIGAVGDSGTGDSVMELESYYAELDRSIFDIYGNTLQFNDISIESSVYDLEPDEGNVFIIFSVCLEMADDVIDFTNITTSYYEIDGKVGKLEFRDYIFEEYFPKSDDSSTQGNGQLVFETKVDIIENLQSGKKGNIYLGWQDLYFEDEYGNSITWLEIPLDTLIEDVRGEDND